MMFAFLSLATSTGYRINTFCVRTLGLSIHVYVHKVTLLSNENLLHKTDGR